MSKLVKNLQIADYRRRFGDADDLLLINVVGMEAIETNQLRLKLRKKGIEVQVVRNNLARKILEEKGYADAAPMLEGPSAVVWGGEDAVALAREITDWAKKIEKLVIKGGCVAGQSFDAQGVESLSKLPSRPEMLAQIANLILSPGARLAAAMIGPGASLASQIKEKAEPAEAAAAEASA